MEEQQETRWICGFWRRIGALIIDILTLGAIGFVLGLAFEELFIDLGSWGRLVGFVVALLYFGLLNSSLAGGQTLGKRLLGIRVVNAQNQTIGLARSFARYTILGLPFFLNNIQLGNESLMYLVYPLSIIIFGGILSIVYLYIFNRVTRQSLHDLVVGTYVVNADAQMQPVGTVWKPHLVVVTVIFLASALVPVYTMQLGDDSPFSDMLSVHGEVMKNPVVRFANVTVGTTTYNISSENSSTTNYVTVQAFVSENVLDDSELARQLAETVIAGYPEAMNKDGIQVILVYGYDIGIWSMWRSQSHNFDPQDIVTDL